MEKQFTQLQLVCLCTYFERRGSFAELSVHKDLVMLLQWKTLGESSLLTLSFQFDFRLKSQQTLFQGVDARIFHSQFPACYWYIATCVTMQSNIRCKHISVLFCLCKDWT